MNGIKGPKKGKREVYCLDCGAVSETGFPFGYRGSGIESCPECGSRSINIDLVKQ